MDYYTGVFESIRKQMNDLFRTLGRAFGIFSETEKIRIQYLSSRGYSVSQAKIIVKIENRYPVTFEELKEFNNLFMREGNK
ncbi:hypothetical protein [Enterococcus casseliflavus]|uniref:hypothetical protein n=1 Tax=Enterococcus casseliflavus TaxID=37734 RepID=UPI0022E59006|nr:hypothetical protein [Enterococcus casseliflavus]